VILHIPCNVSNLPKLDLLHTLQIGMLDHSLKTHERLDKFNAIWRSVPVSHDLTRENQSYVEDSKWIGKEMKEMRRYHLGIVTQSLQGGSPPQRPVVNCGMECTRGLLEFYIYVRFKSHDDVTLNNMEGALHHFHTFKDVY
jgi:hypothetical protein